MAVSNNATIMSGLVDPQVIGEFLSKKIYDYVRFLPLAVKDNTLEGRPGSTLTLPYWNELSADADTVSETGAIPIAKLTESTTSVEIKKIGIGVEISDESLIEAHGDVMGQATLQMAKKIADKMDNEFLAVLNTIGTTPSGGTQIGYDTYTLTAAFKPDDVADALVRFREDVDDAGQVLLVGPKGYATLKKCKDWLPASDIAANKIITGAVGQIYGCQVVVTNKIDDDKASGYSNHNYYIVRPGALRLISKRGVMVENDRDIIHKTTVVTSDVYYCAYLYDATKAIRIALA